MPTVTALWLADRTCNIRNNSRRWRQCRLGRSVGGGVEVDAACLSSLGRPIVWSAPLSAVCVCVHSYLTSITEQLEGVRWVDSVANLTHHNTLPSPHTHTHFAQSNWVLNAVCGEFVGRGKKRDSQNKTHRKRNLMVVGKPLLEKEPCRDNPIWPIVPQ